ncbi:protease Lon-related BREX system protein BrxL [Nostoc sp. 'Peltigera membranacea cyanobiont' 232]|uniref:protease Lon-related BREX system protein BrxL n=1 Tax=Nostoc sp. 'Peltigera membranacea cyanobiont' 232 TaxID=2014531 RepID=UPI000B95A8E0|nr:protease Lon-related BREX system protein BrxL [Nostoc sp. 'Peltigera membranacea cyanobiont' 232]OYE05051.1 TIGR02688 family protein [Nostoc sp. 'Peltigera membranacea cyanobiont' 232]
MFQDALDQKVNQIFPGKVVRKDLLHQIKGGENVPSYVLEYLLGKYCASDDEDEIRIGVQAVKETLQSNYFRHDEANKAQALVEQRGRHRFIDRIEVRYLASENKYWAAMDHFSYSRIHVADRFYRQYERLLEGGIWGLVDVEFQPTEEEGAKASPFHIADLRPIQLARFNIDEYAEGRRSLTRDEWIDILLRSVGLEPTQIEQRLKLLLLTRFIPFVEKNYNFIELGPRGTGKSYAYSEMSPYSILISGGKASTANLFYNNARRQVGLVGHWDVVAFDEVGGLKVTDADAIQIMKDYMANGRFSRGITQVLADASLVFIGNLNQPVETLVQNTATDLFQPLPKEFDLALLDRMHFYLPGWEVPKNSKNLLTEHYGFVTDYLAEAFRTLRKQNRFDEVEKVFRFGSHVEGRDAIAAKKTVSGLLKIIHPDGEWTKENLTEYVELALEGRRRVKEQLKKRGSFEFYKTSFSYIDQESDIEMTVCVPEQGSAGIISQEPLPPGTVYTATANEEARVGLYRLEVACTSGTGKLRTPTGLDKALKESLNRAFSYLQSIKERKGLNETLGLKDIYAEAVDLSGSRVECPCGVAFFVAIISAIQNRQIQAGTLILGDLTIQGNIKGPASIVESLQLAMESGALRALVPLSNKSQFAGLPEEVVEKLDIVFYGDVDRAVIKSVEI